MAHSVSHGLCRRQSFLGETKADRFGESFYREISRSDRLWAYASTGTHVAPEWLVSEERNNGGRYSVYQSTGCGSGSTMMYDSGHPWEKPLMWTVPNEEDVVIIDFSSQV